MVAICFATQRICHHISFAWSVIDSEIEVLDGLNPPCRTQVEIGLSEDILEALVVGEDLTTVSQQIVTLCLQSMDNRCELEVMCGIVELMGAQLT